MSKQLFLHFCFSLQKMVDSKCNTDNFTSLKINIGAIIKNPDMSRFVYDHLKTKKMCKHAVKKLSFVIKYVPDRYKTQGMCHKAVVENGETSKFVPDSYKNQQNV